MTLVGKVVSLGLLLVGILTWVLVRSVSQVEMEASRTAGALSAVELSDNQLTADVLSARAGLINNYDFINRDLDNLRMAVGRLPVAEDGNDGTRRRIAAMAEAKEDAAERFKTLNAVLQNAFAYFGVFARQISVEQTDPAVLIATTKAESAVTRMVQVRDVDNTADVTSGLDALAALPAGGADRQGAVGKLIERGQMLVRLLPEVDTLIGQQRALTFTADLQEMRHRVAAERSLRRQRANILLVTLYVAAAVISVLLIRAGAQLRARTAALRSMVELEQLTLRVSNLFIAVQPDEIEQHLDDMLRILGEGCGVDRAYFLSLEGSWPIWIWQKPDVATPDGWPGTILADFDDINRHPAPAFRTPGGDFQPRPSLARQLAAANARFWTCAKVKRDAEVVGLLCFDRSQPFPFEATQVEALEMLADIVSHALLRQSLHRRQRMLEQKLRRAERLEAVGTFASGIAHNFNNVIGVIAGQAEMAADVLDGDTAASRHVRQIGEASQRAQEMVAEILQFGRPEQKNLRRLSVAKVAADALAQVRAAHPAAAIEATLNSRGADLTLASETRLQQVFVNIIQNAVQVSPEDSPVLVHLDSVASGPLHLSHSELAAGLYTRVTVTDRGGGMAPATLAKLFQPFFSMKPAGTGLGLATARQTLRQIGGGIHVWSALDEGSRFEIYLPQARAQPEPTAASAGSSTTVVLINPDAKGLLQDEELLAALGFEPVGFTDVAAALKAIKADPNRYDAALVEHIGTPAPWTALQVVRAVRQSMAPHKPVVLSTTSTDIEAATLTRIGVSDFVRRPWRTTTIMSALRKTGERRDFRLSEGSDHSRRAPKAAGESGLRM